MSLHIPVDDISKHAADYGPAVYVLGGAATGPPRVTHSSVRFDGGDLLVTVGQQAATLLACNPEVALLWPATDDQSMSLIVDGEVAGAIPPDGGEIRIRPVSAVHHRPAPM